MRQRLSTIVMALSLATLGALGAGSRTAAGQDDPRIDGLMPHDPVVVDPNILADPKTIKTPGRAAPARPASVPTPATSTGPESAPATAPTSGPEAAAPGEDAYAIKLDRPMVAGQAYDVQISAEQKTTNSAVPAGNMQMKVELSGRMAVVSVDDKGVPSELNLTVTRFDIDGKEAVAAGKVINAKHGSAVTYAIVGGDAVNKELKDALDLTLDLEHSSDDAVFGSQTPHKVGDAWPIDSAMAVKQLAKDGNLTADPKNVTGQTTLRGVETVGGVKALRVEATMVIKDLKLTTPNSTVEASDFNAQFGGLFPVDATLPVIEDSSMLDMNMHVSAPSKIDVSFHSSKKETTSPAK